MTLRRCWVTNQLSCNCTFSFNPSESHLISHYELNVSSVMRSENCAMETERYRGITKEALYFVIRAFAPNRAPRLMCLYKFTVSHSVHIQ